MDPTLVSPNARAPILADFDNFVGLTSIQSLSNSDQICQRGLKRKNLFVKANLNFCSKLISETFCYTERSVVRLNVLKRLRLTKLSVELDTIKLSTASRKFEIA